MDAHSSYQYKLLKHDLRKQDADYLLNASIRNELIEGKYFFQSLKKKFFIRLEAEGKLLCVYCQRWLKIYEGLTGNLPKDMATIDHWEAIGEGGYKYVESNFLCSCNTCNNRRADLPSYRVEETKYIF